MDNANVTPVSCSSVSQSQLLHRMDAEYWHPRYAVLDELFARVKYTTIGALDPFMTYGAITPGERPPPADAGVVRIDPAAFDQPAHHFFHLFAGGMNGGQSGLDNPVEDFGEACATGSDDLFERIKRQNASALLFLFVNDLRQRDARQVLFGLVVDDRDVLAALDHGGNVLERDVTARLGIVQLAILIALDDLGLSHKKAPRASAPHRASALVTCSKKPVKAFFQAKSSDYFIFSDFYGRRADQLPAGLSRDLSVRSKDG